MEDNLLRNFLICGNIFDLWRKKSIVQVQKSINPQVNCSGLSKTVGVRALGRRVILD
jgi:hypothetical protein